MQRHVIIDGNNLLYAMYEHAPLPHIGRETLVRIIEQWARQRNDEVTLVFDGPVPRGGLARQMSSDRIDVRFSAPATADDVIVEMVGRAQKPDGLCIVTGDRAIRREAVHRRCAHIESARFVDELFPQPSPTAPPTTKPPEKPQLPTAKETNDWLERFGYDPDEPESFDGHDDRMP